MFNSYLPVHFFRLWAGQSLFTLDAIHDLSDADKESLTRIIQTVAQNASNRALMPTVKPEHRNAWRSLAARLHDCLAIYGL